MKAVAWGACGAALFPQVPPRYALPGAPVHMAAPVVTGFGRGSWQLGTPTANMDPVPLQATLQRLHQGVYYG